MNKFSVENFIVLSSHSDIKRSYHIIVKLKDNLAFGGGKCLKPLVKDMFPEYTKQKIVDLSVYREGLFRTYLNTKEGENRPLVKGDMSDDFVPMDLSNT